MRFLIAIIKRRRKEEEGKKKETKKIFDVLWGEIRRLDFFKEALTATH